MQKKLILNILGVFFLALGILAMINTIYQGVNYGVDLASILWFSYIGMILLGIAILKKDSDLVLSQINILGIPYVFWNIDFFYYLIKGKTLFGLVDYFFESGALFGKIISAQHLITIPLGLFAIYLIGLKTKNAWKLSFIQIFIVFIITRIATTPAENVNCVFKNCANFDFGIPYVLEWFLSYLIMIFITNWIICRIFYKNKKIKK
ncbi:MAG: hypothetical protein Q8P57_00015 [Candidatus Pacearchaeota archaeon]|nr:hypothetical protein [Candidatus Pacearchaeota archaeon]